MSLGWFDDLTNAESYFTNERLETDTWDNATDTQKNKAITQSYNRLFYGTEFTVPTYVNASAEQLIILKKANGEFAFYLLMHLEDEDRRKGIQAQGVIAQRVVKETYDKDMLNKIPIPPIVRDWLDIGGFGNLKSVEFVDIARDEDYTSDSPTPLIDLDLET